MVLLFKKTPKQTGVLWQHSCRVWTNRVFGNSLWLLRLRFFLEGWTLHCILMLWIVLFEANMFSSSSHTCLYSLPVLWVHRYATSSQNIFQFIEQNSGAVCQFTWRDEDENIWIGGEKNVWRDVLRGLVKQGEMFYWLLMCSDEIDLGFSKVKPALMRVGFRNRVDSSCMVALPFLMKNWINMFLIVMTALDWVTGG